MAGNWINAIIDQIDTQLKANYNTKLADIDSTLPTVADAQIFKSRQPFTQKSPIIQQYLVGDSDIPDQGLGTHRIQIFWSLLTTVRIVDRSPSESKGNDLHAYVEALLKTVYEADTNPGKLDNVVCRIVPISWISNEADGSNFIVKEGGILWIVDNTYDPLES